MMLDSECLRYISCSLGNSERNVYLGQGTRYKLHKLRYKVHKSGFKVETSVHAVNSSEKRCICENIRVDAMVHCT